jgi:hypothetical protein
MLRGKKQISFITIPGFKWAIGCDANSWIIRPVEKKEDLLADEEDEGEISNKGSRYYYSLSNCLIDLVDKIGKEAVYDSTTLKGFLLEYRRLIMLIFGGIEKLLATGKFDEFLERNKRAGDLRKIADESLGVASILIKMFEDSQLGE